ncbi:MAG: ABC transporter permease [bacterium]|nr:ABC transporter permease [bacterium]
MSLTRIYAVFIRQIFLFKGNPVRLVAVFLWIFIDIILWGFISKYLSTFGAATFSFVNAVLGAIILWDFLGRIQQGVMTAFLEDIWSQNFINFFTSPLKIKEYVVGLVATSLATGLVGFLAMAVLAGLAFGYNVFKIGLIILPFMLILFIFAVAMGIFMTAIILRFGPSAEWLGWPIPFAMSVFAGVFYPISTLPGALQILSKIIPASYVFESLRGLGGTTLNLNLLTNFFVGFILAVFYLVIMYIFLIMIYRRNLKNGQLSRFSAES